MREPGESDGAETGRVGPPPLAKTNVGSRAPRAAALAPVYRCTYVAAWASTGIRRRRWEIGGNMGWSSPTQ